MSGFKLQRLGILMEPEPGNAQEVEGVLELKTNLCKTPVPQKASQVCREESGRSFGEL